ncbi:MAG: DinB family protein [Cyclobacteriaceae bacterium]|nr:DinB family protein [Cyclobacteriaceae bacterium]
MKILSLLATLILSVPELSGQASDFSKDFSPLWNRACDYTLEVAEMMPEENYSYKPTEKVMSFQAELLHVTLNLYGLCSRYIKGEKVQTPDKNKEYTKKELITELKKAFDYVNETLETISDSETREEIKLFTGDYYKKERVFYLMRDHMTHHRAQMITYLRMNNIEPPSYRGW